MSTDTRPSVTVTGIMDQDCLGWFTIDLDAGGDFLRELGFRDGDEVEVTIRKHERVEDDEEHGLMCDCIDCVGAERIDWRP